MVGFGFGPPSLLMRKSPLSNDGTLLCDSPNGSRDTVNFWLPSMSSSLCTSGTATATSSSVPTSSTLGVTSQRSAVQKADLKQMQDLSFSAAVELYMQGSDASFPRHAPEVPPCDLPDVQEEDEEDDDGEDAPPVDPPSIGSRNHPDSCNPCVFWFKSACAKGAGCSFCHLLHEGQKKKRIRPSKKTRQLRAAAMGRDGSGTSGSGATAYSGGGDDDTPTKRFISL
mmetsp:Transcript_26703/g.61467  ORF Transcript_26703/g.61467 Transcript_26703/m.61467 type:complete len:226 (-) Transcript_26703:105-782(-)